VVPREAAAAAADMTDAAIGSIKTSDGWAIGDELPGVVKTEEMRREI
jgi:hypothetical protein